MGPVPRVCIPLRAVPPRRDASHARIPNAYRQLWMSLRRRLFHTHTHKRTSQKFPAFRFLPYALISLCRSHAPLCIRLLGNSCPGIETNNLSFSWKIISFHHFACPFENSAKFRNRGKLFLSYFIIYLFLKIFREEFWENYFFREKFCVLFQCLFIFRKISRKRRIIGLARNCQKIETIIVEEVFFIRGEKFWRWKLVSNLISLFRRGKN